jgi:hypothetical protein
VLRDYRGEELPVEPTRERTSIEEALKLWKMEGVSALAESLTRLSEELHGLVGRFRV